MGGCYSNKGVFLEVQISTVNLQTRHVGPATLIIHSWFIFKPKNICFSYLNLFKQKKIVLTAWRG